MRATISLRDSNAGGGGWSSRDTGDATRPIDQGIGSRHLPDPLASHGTAAMVFEQNFATRMGRRGHSGRDPTMLVMPMMIGNDNSNTVNDLRNPCFRPAYSFHPLPEFRVLSGTCFGLFSGSRLHPRKCQPRQEATIPPIVGRGSGGTYHEAAGFVRAGFSTTLREESGLHRICHH